MPKLCSMKENNQLGHRCKHGLQNFLQYDIKMIYIFFSNLLIFNKISGWGQPGSDPTHKPWHICVGNILYFLKLFFKKNFIKKTLNFNVFMN